MFCLFLRGFPLFFCKNENKKTPFGKRKKKLFYVQGKRLNIIFAIF